MGTGQKIHATPLVQSDSHDDNPLRTITYTLGSLETHEAIKRGKAESVILSVGGKITVRGAVRFLHASAGDLPSWAGVSAGNWFISRFR